MNHTMYISNRPRRKPLFQLPRIECIELLRREPLQGKLSDHWYDVPLEHPGIAKIGSPADFRPMDLQPVFEVLPHRLVFFGNQHAPLMLIQHFVERVSGLSLRVEVALSGFAIVQDNLRDPLFAFAFRAPENGAGTVGTLSTPALFALFGWLFFIGHAGSPLFA